MADTLLTGTTLIEDKRTGTSLVWSIPGIAFYPNAGDSANVTMDLSAKGEITVGASSTWLSAPVNLPNGAKVTGVIIYGDDTALTWRLDRNDFAGGTKDIMATAAVGTEDTSISNDIIDNNNKMYWLFVPDSTTHTIWGARITFTI